MTLRPEATPTLVAADALIDAALLRALEPAIAALDRLLHHERRAPHDVGEPDGFDGVDHRGTLDRLLPSEWQLAAEAPDEFLRRYEQGELGYFRLGATTTAQPKTSLVLFDCGPEQLGRPRVAHLATLVVLARRARAAGAELRWGTLASPARFPAAGSHALDRLLGARTYESPRELPLDAFVDDCLVVSPLPGPPFAARQLVLRERGDDVLATLHDHWTGTSREALLVMPAADDAVRLLRDPTGQRPATVARTSHAPTSNLVFDQRGHKLLARVEPSRIAIYPVPNSPNDKAGRIRFAATPPHDGVIVAAGRVRRSVLTVSISPDANRIIVRRFGGNITGPTGIFPVDSASIAGAVDDPVLGRLTWVDNTLRVHLPTCRLTHLPTGAYRVDPADRALHWRPHGAPTASATPVGDRWQIRASGREWWYGDGPVLGVFAWPEFAGARMRPRVRIVVIGDGARALLALGEDGEREVVYSSAEDIVDAVTHDVDPVVALRTTSGRIVIRSLVDGGPRHEIAPR